MYPWTLKMTNFHLVETSANKNFKICARDDRIMKMKKAVKAIVDTVSRHIQLNFENQSCSFCMITTLAVVKGAMSQELYQFNEFNVCYLQPMMARIEKD